MKFKYDLTKNYYEIFDESQGIVLFRKEIKKNIYNIKKYTVRCKGYVMMTLGVLIIAILAQLIKPYGMFTDILWILFALIVALVAMMIFLFYFSYNQQRKLLNKGEIEFSKKGIVDNSESGLTIGVTWDLVDFVVITDTVIVILTNTNFYFHFGQDLIDDVLIALNKYQKDITIYDASISRYREKIYHELEEQHKKEDEREAKKKVKKTVADIKEIKLDEKEVVKE